jgi:hypothetical protein
VRGEGQPADDHVGDVVGAKRGDDHSWGERGVGRRTRASLCEPERGATDLDRHRRPRRGRQRSMAIDLLGVVPHVSRCDGRSDMLDSTTPSR